MKSNCIAVTCITCDTPFIHLESPFGCASCGMLEWMPAYETEEECNADYKEEFPEEFDSNGDYIDFKIRDRNRKIKKITEKI